MSDRYRRTAAAFTEAAVLGVWVGVQSTPVVVTTAPPLDRLTFRVPARGAAPAVPGQAGILVPSGRSIAAAASAPIVVIPGRASKADV